MSVRSRPAVVAAAVWLATVAILQGRFVLLRGVAVGNVAPLVSVLHAGEGAVGVLIGVVSVLIPVLAVAALDRDVRALGDDSGVADKGYLVLDSALLAGALGHLWLLVITPNRLSSVELFVATFGLTLISIVVLGAEAGRQYRRTGPTLA